MINLAVKAILQNGETVDIKGLMWTTIPNGSTQQLYYYVYNGINTPLIYAHSPVVKYLFDDFETGNNDQEFRPKFWHNPASVEFHALDHVMSRVAMRYPERD